MTMRLLRAAAASFAPMLASAADAGAGEFALSSPSVVDGKRLPEAQVMKGHGCSGGNVSPELAWSSPPAGAKSFAVTVFDPDAPTGAGWWHWIVFDIPADARGLPQGASRGGALPKGAVEGRNDFDEPGYGGACPPRGKPHRYVFTVHALKVQTLGLTKDVSGATAGPLIERESLGSSSITASYGR
jgi:hypothetical protein